MRSDLVADVVRLTAGRRVGPEWDDREATVRPAARVAWRYGHGRDGWRWRPIGGGAATSRWSEGAP